MLSDYRTNYSLGGSGGAPSNLPVNSYHARYSCIDMVGVGWGGMGQGVVKVLVKEVEIYR